MKIVAIVGNVYQRGSFWRAYYFGQLLAQRGHEVTVLCADPVRRRGLLVEREEAGRLMIVRSPDLLRGNLRNGWDLWATLARTLLLNGSNCDVIHAYECRPTVIVPALWLRKRSGARLAIDWCDWFGRGGSVEERSNPVMRAILRPPETFFEEYFRQYADQTTVINSVLAGRAAQLGVDPATITIINNGCDRRPWPPEDRTAARHELGLPLAAKLVTYVGTIFPRDAQLLAAAFDALHAQEPAARLLVAGYCPIDLRQLVRTPSAVIQTGPLSNRAVMLAMRAADQGWLTLCDSGANRGRWPLKFNSYLEAGLPIVASAVGDIPAMLTATAAGVAVAPAPAAHAAASLALLRDPARAAQYAANGIRAAEGLLSRERQVDLLEQVYQRLQQQP